MKKEYQILYIINIIFIAINFWDVKIAIWGCLLGIVLFPFYLVYKKKKNKAEELLIEKRTKTISAQVTNIEKESRWGEDSYCVVCEYWFGSEKFTFRSIPVKYELDLSVGQEVAVMVEPNDFSNYYVILNDFINVTDLNREAVKIGKLSVLPEHMNGLTREKQLFIVGWMVLTFAIIFTIDFLLFQGALTKTQVRVICLLIGGVILSVRKKVGWW